MCAAALLVRSDEYYSYDCPLIMSNVNGVD